MKDKVVIGIFGKIGTGKSLVAEIFSRKYGFSHINVDKIGHCVLAEKKKKIVSVFGSKILDKEGNIDRKILGDIVFLDPEKNFLLTSIVHPIMKKKVERIVKDSKENRFVIDAALLFEIGLDEFSDFLIKVEAPEKLIFERVRATKGWNDKKIKMVLKRQAYIDLLGRRADFIIFNNAGVDKIEKQIDFFMNVIF